MENPKSSFWGNVSYIGRVQKDPSKVTVAIAGLEFCIHDTDPAIGHLRVTSGNKKTFVVLETINSHKGIHRVLAVYKYPKADARLVRSVQEMLQDEETTLRDLSDWDPDYVYEPKKE